MTDAPLTCDIRECEAPALVTAYPTYGQTDHEANRCRDHLEEDLDREWFRQWREDLAEKQEVDDD